MIKKLNKLVRDRIPEIIKKNKAIPTTHIAADDEYKEALLNKLGEETAEFRETPTLEEAADILEVLKAIYNLMGWNLSDIEKIRQDVQKKRGGYKKKIILESVESNA